MGCINDFIINGDNTKTDTVLNSTRIIEASKFTYLYILL